MDLYTKLSTCMEELSSTFTSRMSRYEEDLKNASNESGTHKSIASLSRDFIEFKGIIWKTMSALKSQMELLVVGLDRHEMASRTKVLLLHGLPEDNSAPLMSQLINTFSRKMNMAEVSPTQITSCHRLGSNMNKPRPLLVRFESRILRSEVWRNKAMLKGTGLTFSEFLTKPRHDVFMNARKLYGMQRCWTSDGKIIVQVSDNTRRKIETVAELRDLMVQFPAPESTSNNADVENKVSHGSKHKPNPSASDKKSRKPVRS